MEVNLDDLDLPQSILAPCRRHGIHTSVDLDNYSQKDQYFRNFTGNSFLRKKMIKLNEGLRDASDFNDVIKALCEMENVHT